MATIPTKIKNVYNYLFNDLADPRTSKWLLLEDPFSVYSIIIVYVYFVTKLGPAIMKSRKPFKLKTIMIVYNTFQICINSFIFITAFKHAYGPGGKWSFWCEPIDRSTSPLAMYTIKCFYIYFMVKFLDLFDTVLMVLRKKQSHVTFLHVYHHAGMVPLCWGALKYAPGGHGVFFGMINCFVHAVMYTYYLLTTISPPQDRYKLRWKKYLTLLQLVQFFIIGFHATLPLFQPSCDYPKIGAFVVTPQLVFMAVLFMDFYIKAYIKTKSQHNAAFKPKLNGTIKFDENKNKIS